MKNIRRFSNLTPQLKKIVKINYFEFFFKIFFKQFFLIKNIRR